MAKLSLFVVVLSLLVVYVLDLATTQTTAITPKAVGPVASASSVMPSLSEPVAEVRMPRQPVAPEPSISPASSGAAPPPAPDFAAELELQGLRSRVEWLEMELVLCGSGSAEGPMADWLAILRPDERPAAGTLRLMVEYLRPYPVALTVNEGLWIAERIAADDWENYGPTVDEVLIAYLGASRLAAELSAEQLAPLRELWSDEGLFP